LVFMQSVANLCTPQFKKKKKPIFQPNSGWSCPHLKTGGSTKKIEK
jgi:hypothetical protein